MGQKYGRLNNIEKCPGIRPLIIIILKKCLEFNDLVVFLHLDINEQDFIL